MVTAVMFSLVVAATAPDASAQAYAHVLLAERYVVQGAVQEAVRELRYALVFDYESAYLHARLRQLVGEPKKVFAQRTIRRRVPSLDPRLKADTQAGPERGKNVAERSAE